MRLELNILARYIQEMTLRPRNIHAYLFFNLPAAFFTGVRVISISTLKCETSVTYGWRNQNPFKSIFWAVQGMAAELSTGALLMAAIKGSGQKISMLVTRNNGEFFKKAKGRVVFTCNDGNMVSEVILKAISTGEAQQLIMKSEGKDTSGDVVSIFEFEWSIKLKTPK